MDVKPTLTEDYRNTFKGVDNLDTALGHIKWPYRVHNLPTLMGLAYVRLTLASCFAYFVEATWDENVQNRDLSIRKFVVDLADELYQR